jgi:hypothetical protein
MIHSEQINELASALVKAQAEMDVAPLNCKNPFFKSRYADMRAIVEASRPALTKHGLAVSQIVTHDSEGSAYLQTLLCHTSGQWLMASIKITPAKNDIQSISSYMTYVKRMCYASIVGVVTGDEDDDGEAAVSEQRVVDTRPRPFESGTITPEQLEVLERELSGYPQIAEDIMERLKITKLSQFPSKGFVDQLERIKKIKAVLEGEKR